MAAADGRPPGDPVPVAAADLPVFLSGAPLAVLLVSVHPAHTFSPALARQLAADLPDAALGTADVRDVLTTGGRGLRLLREGFGRCGIPTLLGLLPGYCLFRGRTMLAWDAGLPAPSDLAGIAQGTVLGAIWAGVTRETSWLREAIQLAADQATADRIATRFRLAASASSSSFRPDADPAREPSGTADAVAWAYRTLSVAPEASDAQVQDAWKRLRIAHHPDRVAGDAAEFGRRNRASADINRARDIIMEHRARTRGGAYARAS
jgi:hypothetical protein